MKVRRKIVIEYETDDQVSQDDEAECFRSDPTLVLDLITNNRKTLDLRVEHVEVCNPEEGTAGRPGQSEVDRQ